MSTVFQSLYWVDNYVHEKNAGLQFLNLFNLTKQSCSTQNNF